MKRLSSFLQKQDYQNPTKLKQFSPSPIKRYVPKTNFQNDNKENIGYTQQRMAFQKNLANTFAVPQQRLGLSQRQLGGQNINGFVVPLKTSILSNIDRKEYLQDQKLQNQDSKIMIFDHINKRQEKLQSKENSHFSKIQRSLGSGLSQDSQLEVPIRNIQISSNQQSPEINQNLEKEGGGESPMDATYQSTNSILNGVQFQGRWTSLEHQKFIDGLKLFGKDWKKIEDHIGSRTCAQIRSHAQKYFNRLQRQASKSKPSNHKPKIVQEEVKSEPIKEVAPPKVIQKSTNQQLQQIQETFSKLAEEDLSIQLNQKLQEREIVAHSYLTKKFSAQEACEKLIVLTNEFHSLAMLALSNYKCKFLINPNKDIFAVLVEICNRMIDERNLTQLICIMLSNQVTVVPDVARVNSGVLQHVYANVPSYIQKDQNMNGIVLPTSKSGYEQRETARTSPNGRTHSEEFKEGGASNPSFSHDHHQY